jgi:hypothetical protein
LAELGKQMKRKEADDGRRNNIFAGFTYLGQMIDHDLTFDITPLKRCHPFEDRMQNFRTPFLDLEVLYGGGPTVSPFLYNLNSRQGEERFLIGKTREADHQEGRDADLPRNARGIALVGDPRQDENLIIAQLHVHFLKRHNQLVEKLPADAVVPAGGSRFEQARRLLTWTYQYYALNFFIKKLVDRSIFNRLQEKFTVTPFVASSRFRIPIEFSVAAFRFGHSMVRDSYDYNQTHRHAKLYELLTQTGIGGGACPSLKQNWIIALDRFFKVAGYGEPSNDAQQIRPSIARDLFQVQPTIVKLFNVAARERPGVKSHCNIADDPETMLPVRTLWRGARMGLPSGQDVAKALPIPNAITTDKLEEGLRGDLVTKYHFHQDTPLWYYILREAEVFNDGKRLGPVGSWIVASTIFAALKADPNSYLSIHPRWKPTIGLRNEFAQLTSSSEASMADNNI